MKRCISADTSFKPKPMENMAANGYLNRTNEYSYRKAPSVTPTRTTTSSVSRYSTDRNSFLSPSPTPQPHTPRAERPWRQRLAESSRIRASLGDDVSASYVAARSAYARSRSSRRGSLTQTSGDELSQSVDRLRNYISASGVRSVCGGASLGRYSAISRPGLNLASVPSFCFRTICTNYELRMKFDPG
ncbi:hypothetical protein NECAME_14147 [Necator americanus]|uniref:Uncharacterized protein n=1 Tax=Necator americanus TaxID=51031 RepID=W2SQ56_NECAM|nr:hypothetical protein NECAME_14147 [Necator americanus]ETN71658.1 hypothetical protein NECAME_14147 [Necator americanus]